VLFAIKEAVLAVRAHRGGSPLAFLAVNSFCIALLYGCAGRLIAENGCFRPGQSWKEHGIDGWFAMPAPATPEAVQLLCPTPR
jgi:hypothetical protein